MYLPGLLPLPCVSLQQYVFWMRRILTTKLQPSPMVGEQRHREKHHRLLMEETPAVTLPHRNRQVIQETTRQDEYKDSGTCHLLHRCRSVVNKQLRHNFQVPLSVGIVCLLRHLYFTAEPHLIAKSKLISHTLPLCFQQLFLASAVLGDLCSLPYIRKVR